jgi:hypothetical protein
MATTGGNRTRRREVERTSTTSKLIKKMMKRQTRSVMTLTMTVLTMSKRKMMNLTTMREGRDKRRKTHRERP